MKKSIPFKSIPASSMRKLAIGAWGAPNNPSASVELVFDVSRLNDHLPSGIQLKHAMIKLLSTLLNQVPQLNTVIVRRKLRQRLNNRIFIPTVFRHQGMLDLSGIFIDNAHALTCEEIKQEMAEKVSALRMGQDATTNRVVSFFKACPSFLCKPIIRCMNFIHYSCNLSLSMIGFPNDPFGSLTLTFLDKFDIKHAHIPIYSFSKSPLTIAIGATYMNDTKTLLPVTVTFDHRHFDGYEGYRAYKKLTQWLKQPSQII
jgi:hypothetical protein